MTIYGDSTAWVVLFGGTESIVGDTNSNTTINDLSGAEVALCKVGMPISGTDIPASTYITAVGESSITISQAATGTTNDVTLTIRDAVFIRTEDQPDIGEADQGLMNINYPGRGHYGFTLVTEDVKIKLTKIFSVTKAEHDDLVAGIRNIQDSSNPILLRIQVASTPTYYAFDGGSKLIMPVRIKTINGRKKLYGGNSTIYVIGQIQLVQTGDLITITIP